jgi:membrane fusion protein, multidrug efflux system
VKRVDRFGYETNHTVARLARAVSLRATILALLAASLGACNEEEAAPSPIRLVRTQVVEIVDWKDTGSAIGEIKPRYESEVGFRIAGKIASRLVDVGAAVEAGTVIAKLDSTNEQIAVRVAENGVKAAQAELDDAIGQEARQRELMRHNATPQANYDAAERRLKLAMAKLESAELSRKDAVERLGYTELRSDDAAVVTAVGAQPGQVVAVGHMVVRLARTDVKEAEFRISEQTLRSVPRDPLVDVSLLTDPNIRTSGHVREIATSADPVTRTFAVRVTLTDPPEAMRFGTTVQGWVVFEEKQVVKLPSSALVKSDDGSAVWIFDSASSTVALRRVSVLRYEADQVLVIDGLVKGEIVVTAGVQMLWPGMKVRLL